MEHLLLFLILESLTLKDFVYIAVTVIGALWLWKSGLPQQMFQSSMKLVEVRTIERDDAIKEKDKYKGQVEELEEQILVLRRELVQRIAISLQDQEEMNELRKRLK